MKTNPGTVRKGVVKVDNVIALAADEFLVKFKLLVAGLLCVLEAGSSERAR